MLESVYDNTTNCDKSMNTVNLLLCMYTEIHITQDFTLSFSFSLGDLKHNSNCHSCCRFICKVFSNLALKWENNQNAASWQPVELSLLLQLDNVASKLRSLTQTHTDFKVLPTCQIRHLHTWSFYPRTSSLRDRLLPI